MCIRDSLYALQDNRYDSSRIIGTVACITGVPGDDTGGNSNASGATAAVEASAQRASFPSPGTISSGINQDAFYAKMLPDANHQNSSSCALMAPLCLQQQKPLPVCAISTL